MDEPSRRRLLRAVGVAATAALAGCPSQPSETPAAGDDSTTASTADSTPTERPPTTTATTRATETTPSPTTPAAEGQVSVDSVESSVPDVRADVTLDRSAITPDATARVICTLTNTGEKRPFWFGYAPPLYRPRGTAVDGEGTGWVLQDPNYRDAERASERCWQPTQAYGIEGRPEDRYRLATDESVASSVEFWTAEEASVCLPTGRFRFDSEVRIGEGFADAERASWSVVFRVEEA